MMNKATITAISSGKGFLVISPMPTLVGATRVIVGVGGGDRSQRSPCATLSASAKSATAPA